MTRFTLDASALLALIQGERGCERVLAALEEGDSIISAVNLCEVMTKLILTGVPSATAETIVYGIPVQSVPIDDAIAVAAARLAMIGKPLGLSLGDRICLATAQAGGGTVLTTEQIWQNLSLAGVVIETIRKPLETQKAPTKPTPPKGRPKRKP